MTNETTFREIQPGEEERFNNFIKDAPQGDYLQSYEWGQMKAKSGWQPIYVVAEQNGGFKAAATVLKKKLPVLGAAFFYTPRGPVMDYRDEQTVDLVLEGIKDLAGRHNAILLKIDPDIPATEAQVREMLMKKGFVPARRRGRFDGLQPRHVCRLGLEKDPEEIFKSFNEKTRYNIRLAEKRGVTVREGGKEALPVFYNILQETCKRDNFVTRGYDYFGSVWDHSVEKGLGKLFMAEYQGEYIAGVWVINFGKKAWYLYGASSNRHRNVMPNYALQWHAIRWAREQGCTLYDFLGVPSKLSPNSPAYGLYRFKKGFNSELTEFIGEFDLPFRRPYYHFWRVAEPVYAKTVVNLGRAKQRLKQVTRNRQ